MQTINVSLPHSAYDILIGTELCGGGAAARALTPFVQGRRALLISDSNVDPLYVDRLLAVVGQAGASQADRAVFPAGEASKTLATLEQLYHTAMAQGLDRSSVAIAVGGGVVGDVAGFFAATFMRGIDFIQVPTTLLALVDSSVGGKVAVDLPEGKNLVGAFYQPRLVLADLAFLQTLPPRELRCGLAEVLKYGVIMDSDLFAFLEQHADGIVGLDVALMEEIVARCCALKTQVVVEDEREQGRRAILNYGHTFGHALESFGQFTVYNHGEAVSIGMGMAGDCAVALAMCSRDDVLRQDALVSQFGLPARFTQRPLPDPAVVLELMYRDKKVRGGKLRLVLPTGIGAVQVVGCEARDVICEAIGGRLG